MTEQRSALDSALDLLLYAPVGFALTAAEEIPKLAAKGRAQVQGQVTMARMVGQFAVAQGRKEIEKRLGVASRPQPAAKPREAPSHKHAPTNGAASGAASENGSYERLSGRSSANRGSGASSAAPSEEGSVIDVDFGTSARGESARPGTRAGSETSTTSAAPETPRAAPTTAAPAGPAPVADGLAIPGYDSLSASQVVQRLAGLSQDELAAVGEYEAAHRGRRTILTRVGQLKG